MITLENVKNAEIKTVRPHPKKLVLCVCGFKYCMGCFIHCANCQTEHCGTPIGYIESKFHRGDTNE